MEQKYAHKQIPLQTNKLQNAFANSRWSRYFKEKKKLTQNHFPQAHTAILYSQCRLLTLSPIQAQRDKRVFKLQDSAGFVTLPTLLIALLILMTSAQFLKASRKYHDTNKQLISGFQKRWH